MTDAYPKRADGRSHGPVPVRVGKPRNGIAKTGIVTDGVERPKPLPGLTREQAVEWRVIVNRMPANHFPAETWPVLANLCRHIVNSNDISAAMEEVRGDLADKASRKAFSELARMLDRESRIIANLSGRLRLTPQSRMQSYHLTAELKKSHGADHEPWNG